MVRRPSLRACLPALLLLILGACATPQTDLVQQNRASYPAKAEVDGVPFYPQEDHYCGPAALATVLSWSGLPVTQEDTARQVYTPKREGTLQTDIVAAARRNGRLAVPVKSLPVLLAEIAAGRPVLVFQNLALDWYPQWHYAVAFGYDLEAGDLLLRSGRDARHRISLGAFERTWRRGDYWALVVLPPGELPVSADEKSVLDAAAGLSRAKRHAEAATAFAAIAKRWPRSFVAKMGLGNARYAEGDWAHAERAYRGAIAIAPDAPSAWNNLAYALAKQKQRTAALDAASKAVALGGANATSYKETLTELSAAAR